MFDSLSLSHLTADNDVLDLLPNHQQHFNNRAATELNFLSYKNA